MTRHQSPTTRFRNAIYWHAIRTAGPMYYNLELLFSAVQSANRKAVNFTLDKPVEACQG